MNCPTKNPLQRDGTSQYERMLEALNASSAPLHEYTLKDWMKFAYHYARKVNYYNISNDVVPQGDWAGFLIPDNDIELFVKNTTGKENIDALEPHLALFISFIRLMKHPASSINDVTKKHLDFYYKEVLALKSREAINDKVHLVFELAKNFTSYKIDDDTLFDGGKDASGKPREYSIQMGPVFSQGKVEFLKSVYHKKDHSIRVAQSSNTADGIEAPLKDDAAWYAFGYDDKAIENNKDNFVLWPAAKLGFSLASSALFLKEGLREITITLDLSFSTSNVDFTAFNSLRQHLVVLLTGEKNWVTPLSIDVTKTPSSVTSQLKIKIVIDRAEKAITGYNQAIHKENYNTDLPVIRFLLETDQSKGYNAYDELSKANITKVTIDVDVKGMKDLSIENDDGKLDAAKPFLPFGSVPRKGSSFYLGNEEIFGKKWKQIKLHTKWKNKPDDLKAHYTAYRDIYLKENFSRNRYDLITQANGTIKTTLNAKEVVTGDSFFKVNISYIKNGQWTDEEDIEKSIFTDNPIVIGESTNIVFYPSAIDFGFIQLFATTASPVNSYMQQYITMSPIKSVFDAFIFNPGFTITTLAQPTFNASTKNGFIRIRLANSLYHQQFPILYAAAMTIPGAVIPKEPYTPMMESLEVDYTASVENDFGLKSTTQKSKLQNYTKRSVQLFHETPFGQSEQHAFLKEQQTFISATGKLALVPTYISEAEFYVGLKNVETETIVSILFQVAEGSEDPEAPIFLKEKPIEWWSLCSNEWKPLNQDFIISNNTNNFLRSGLIKFLIPKETTTTNAVMPAGYTWLKASLPKDISFGSVCRFIAVIAQVEAAEFINNDNELSHLETALPAGTISKMINKQSAVKSVNQPFNSFGGLPKESDRHFYIRVSERLRHKNRAVNIWDYERLVLEKFPSVYKVKCLNHTDTDFELVPGSVRVIPIPDLRNKNVYDIYRPRVSRNTLTEIESYLHELHGFHIDLKAENPLFEQVEFSMKVRFYEQYDPKAYAKILEDELKKYLSPWAFDEMAEIHFGGALYQSRVVAFIDERHYVDFIKDFKMRIFKPGSQPKEEIIAESSRAILTSAKKHFIEPIEPPVCP